MMCYRCDTGVVYIMKVDECNITSKWCDVVFLWFMGCGRDRGMI